MIDFTPLLAVVIVDIFGLDMLWGERRTYRFINHLSKGLFDSRKQPWIVRLPKLIEEEDRKILNNLVLPDEVNITTTSPRASKALHAMYSPRSAIYYDGMDQKTRDVVDIIGEKCMESIAKACPEQPKLFMTNSNFRACILRYEGEKANFAWHYDTEDPSCMRILALIYSEGKVSPLAYIDEDGKEKQVVVGDSDGWVFKGTTTLHRVRPSGDPKTVRHMVGFQYTTDPIACDKHKSFCSELRGKPASAIFPVYVKWFAVHAAMFFVIRLLFPSTFEAELGWMVEGFIVAVLVGMVLTAMLLKVRPTVNPQVLATLSVAGLPLLLCSSLSSFCIVVSYYLINSCLGTSDVAELAIQQQSSMGKGKRPKAWFWWPF